MPIQKTLKFDEVAFKMQGDSGTFEGYASKWGANASTDGTHQSSTGNALLKTEYQTKLGTVTVT